ncbi:hypothetical protein FPOAC2_04086 [Fusarium poae]|jgi:hypothetical protein
MEKGKGKGEKIWMGAMILWFGSMDGVGRFEIPVVLLFLSIYFAFTFMGALASAPGAGSKIFVCKCNICGQSIVDFSRFVAEIYFFVYDVFRSWNFFVLPTRIRHWLGAHDG